MSLESLELVREFAALDVEEAILGALMSDVFRDRALSCIVDLRPSDFYAERNRQIYSGIMELVRAGKKPDLLLLHEMLPTMQASELVDIQGAACMPDMIPHYVEILQQKSRERQIYTAVQEAQAAFAKGDNCEKIEEYLMQVLTKQRITEGTATLADIGDVRALFEIDESEHRAINFGIEELDIAMGGLRPGEVCIVAARTSVGKSALAVLVALNAALSGWNTLYMSYEMPTEQIWKRMLSYYSRVSLRKFRDEYFHDIDRIRILNAYEDIKPALAGIRVNTVANRPGLLSALVKIEQISSGAEFLVIDHAGRMLADGKARTSYERMSEIAHSLKNIALQNNVPVLVLWQLSRKVEYSNDKKPTLADLRDSGEAEEVADFVLLLSRDSYYDRDIPIQDAMVTVDVAKARDGGQLGEIRIPWLRLISRPVESEQEK